jgi:serine/threonine-protein kinase HipA
LSPRATPRAAGWEQVDVVLDADLLPVAQRVGTLFRAAAHGRSVVSFGYDRAWLALPGAFQLDPNLHLHDSESYPAAGNEGFGVFMDSAPDRWGRVLLDRREALLARQAGRPERTLTEWDYLLGVHDLCRTGALRFRRDGASPFLDDNHALAAPPVTSLGELEAAAAAMEQPDAADNPRFSEWLTSLLAPGSSLGGARPKANFTAADGSLWIAKFPSRDDRWDVGAWEKLVHDLAQECGIIVPPGNLLDLGSRHRTFSCQRFDRTGDRRRFFVSAMTLLGRQDMASASYLDLAEFITYNGRGANIASDLRQLWTRLVFNILVSNTDDHLRNHGFIMEDGGWCLAPAYDVNPNPDRATHALAIDAYNPSSDLALARDTAGHYALNLQEAEGIISETSRVVGSWDERARALGISRVESEALAKTFKVRAT